MLDLLSEADLKKSSMLDSSEFRFWVPFEKAAVREEGGQRHIYGVASTEDLDLDEEVVSASGLKKSLDYFLQHGRIDWDHKSKDEPKFIIGEPVDGRFDGANKFHLHGVLYKGQEIADQVWDLLKAGCTRLGWSIGGKVIKKAMSFDKSLGRLVPKVVEARITHVACTPHPKNTHTFATAQAYGAFMKSLTSADNAVGQLLSVSGKEYVFVERGELEKAIAASASPSAGGTALGTNAVIPQSLESDVKVFTQYAKRVRAERLPVDADAAKQWFKSQGLPEERADALAHYVAKNAHRISR